MAEEELRSMPIGYGWIKQARRLRLVRWKRSAYCVPAWLKEFYFQAWFKRYRNGPVTPERTIPLAKSVVDYLLTQDIAAIEAEFRLTGRVRVP